MSKRLRRTSRHPGEPEWKLFVFISGDEGADSGFGLFVKALPNNLPIAGGAYRDRTDDLKLAKLALSQLS